MANPKITELDERELENQTVDTANFPYQKMRAMLYWTGSAWAKWTGDADFLFNYKLSDYDDTADPNYLGYLNKDGAWYIQKLTYAGAVTYAAGASGYNFANRAAETYATFSVTF